MKHSSLALPAICGIALLAATSFSTRASIIAYDSFDYPSPGNLDAQNGGGGWAGPWGTSGNGGTYTVTPGLTYTGLQDVTGNATTGAAASAQIFRALSTPVNFTGSGSLYVGFLLSQTAVNFGDVLLTGPTVNTGNVVSFGDPYTGNGASSFYAINGEGSFAGGFNPSSVPINTDGSTHLLVLELDYDASLSSTTGFLYLDPPTNVETLDQSTSIAQIVGAGAPNFDRIRLEGASTSSFDEIRIGTTYQDIVTVPEPSSVALATIGISGMLFVIRRKRVA